MKTEIEWFDIKAKFPPYNVGVIIASNKMEITSGIFRKLEPLPEYLKPNTGWNDFEIHRATRGWICEPYLSAANDDYWLVVSEDDITHWANLPMHPSYLLP